MGSSIGLGSCKTVSATLGGYVSIGKRIYILTVNHFIDYAIGVEAATGMSQDTITSPSLLDVEELTEDLKQTVRDTDATIEDIAKRDFPSGQVTLQELRQHEDIIALMDNRDIFERFLRDLSRKPDEFYLGKIHQRCVPELREAVRAYKLPSPNHENIQMYHRMDWSIFSVKRARAGQNRHRHKFCTESGTVDFLSENLYPLGAGSLCQQTCEVEPGIAVYYVGQSSGRQSGKISAGPVSVTCGGKRSLEWAMVVPEDEQQEGEIYCGDSGAWIIRESDNALVGLLWGWINGQLIFTPINDVFADITETLNATEICLPKLSTAPDPSTLNICRVKSQTTRKPRSYSSTTPLRSSFAIPNYETPRPGPISISSLIDPNGVPKKKAGSMTPKTDTNMDRSPSPAPSLSSSVSSSQKTMSRSPSLVELQPQPDCNLDKVTFIVSEDSDAERDSKAEEELQMSPDQKPEKCRQEHRLSLGYILDNDSLAKNLAMLTFPESSHEVVGGKSGNWPSVETWRRGQGMSSS
jgi:hypothetical protein